jgi:hypothetical protein
MLILAFIVSILAFNIADILITAISLTLYTFLIGLAQKKIKGYTDASIHSLNQFVGATLGVSIASYIGYYIATWIEADINLNVLFGIYSVTYYFLNFYTKEAIIKPWAQKIGALLGFSIMYNFLNNL